MALQSQKSNRRKQTPSDFIKYTANEMKNNAGYIEYLENFEIFENADDIGDWEDDAEVTENNSNMPTMKDLANAHILPFNIENTRIIDIKPRPKTTPRPAP